MDEKNLEKIVAKAAKKIASRNVNSACWWILYQPVLSPNIIEKLKK